ncbi:MAG: hypothetical protein UX36_C0006G0008 [Microgenomates group bacterium GW2011_GWC1_46_15]|nr:MAG: hypothetical protein UX36_C0006G0008 [Microgenomates group bacterium GW2011_GWC1_46_15]
MITRRGVKSQAKKPSCDLREARVLRAISVARHLCDSTYSSILKKMPSCDIPTAYLAEVQVEEFYLDPDIFLT